VDAPTLVDAMLGPGRLSAARAAQLMPGLHQAMKLANLNTINRRAMFLAQCGEESGSLRFTEEIASGSEYEGRADLGNTEPGDGVRFKGRTFIQITGRHNYAALSAWAHAKDIVPTPWFFVDHPVKLAGDQYVWLGPVWYWTVARPSLNGDADRGDVIAATYAVNGGQNGIDDRMHRWAVCKRLGSRLMDTATDVVDEEDEVLIIRDAGVTVAGNVAKDFPVLVTGSTCTTIEDHDTAAAAVKAGAKQLTVTHRDHQKIRRAASR
jgi:predicted chitinase